MHITCQGVKLRYINGWQINAAADGEVNTTI